MNTDAGLTATEVSMRGRFTREVGERLNRDLGIAPRQADAHDRLRLDIGVDGAILRAQNLARLNLSPQTMRNLGFRIVSSRESGRRTMLTFETERVVTQEETAQLQVYVRQNIMRFLNEARQGQTIEINPLPWQREIMGGVMSTSQAVPSEPLTDENLRDAIRSLDNAEPPPYERHIVVSRDAIRARLGDRAPMIYTPRIRNPFYGVGAGEALERAIEIANASITRLGETAESRVFFDGSPHLAPGAGTMREVCRSAQLMVLYHELKPHIPESCTKFAISEMGNPTKVICCSDNAMTEISETQLRVAFTKLVARMRENLWCLDANSPRMMSWKDKTLWRHCDLEAWISLAVWDNTGALDLERVDMKRIWRKDVVTGVVVLND